MKYVFIAFFFISLSSYAEDKPQKEVESKFICVKTRKSSLAEFKERLVDECDLNRPFSASTADNAIETSFMFCCHKK